MSEESPRPCLEPRPIFATGNAYKINELEAILVLAWQGYASGATARVSNFNAPAPLKDGAAFGENSLIKARALVKFTGLPTLADDLGICAGIMGGVPRILSTH